MSTDVVASTRARRGLLHSRPVLLLAFAFAVMADPVSSVAYAIEAALRALHGDLGLLAATMTLVVGLIALVIVNYHHLVARYPNGGGAAAAAGEAFGEGWAFLPIGALIVDFVLTIAISAAAGASALIAYLPALAGWRLELALALIVAVAGLTWFGHLGRAVFAMMTVGFIALAATVLAYAVGATPHPTGTITHTAGHESLVAVALAFPVAMALAAPHPVFAAFQLMTALLLLAAASSSFQAGPGLLKALSRRTRPDGAIAGVLPGGLGRTNSHHTPFLGVLVFLAASAVVTAAAGARDQELVLFYAVSVFLSFLAGLIAMAVFSRREHRPLLVVVNAVAAAGVGFTLAVNLLRGDPVISLAAALLIAAGLYGLWVRAGRPGGIRNVTAAADTTT